MESGKETDEPKYSIYVFLLLNLILYVLIFVTLPSINVYMKANLIACILIVLMLLFAIRAFKLKTPVGFLINKVVQLGLIVQLVFTEELIHKSCLYLLIICDNQQIQNNLVGLNLKLYRVFLYLFLSWVGIQTSALDLFNCSMVVLAIVLYCYLDFVNEYEIKPISDLNSEKVLMDELIMNHLDSPPQSPAASFSMSPIRLNPGLLKLNEKDQNVIVIDKPKQELSRLIEESDSDDSFEIDLFLNPMLINKNVQNVNQSSVLNIYESEQDWRSRSQYLSDPKLFTKKLKSRELDRSKDFVESTDKWTSKGLRDCQRQQEQVWRERLNEVPVPLLLVQRKTKKIIYQNTFFQHLCLSTLQFERGQEFNFLLNLLEFKIIDQGNKNLNLTMKLSKTHVFKQGPFFKARSPNKGQTVKIKEEPTTSTKKQMSMRQSFHLVDEADDDFGIQSSLINRTFTLTEILQLIIDTRELNTYINSQDGTLEMYCTYKEHVHLNLRVKAEETGDLLLIIQDYSKQNYQNQILKVLEQNQFKTKMINSFSHELRTPLNSASLFLKSALLDKDVSIQIREQYLVPSLSALLRQKYLINDIIDYSQINAEVFEIQYSIFSITDIIQELTQLFHYEFTMKKLGLSFNVHHDTPRLIRSDYQRLIQVLYNILQNSQKFSYSGYVCVTISCDKNQHIDISIRDEGTGMTFQKLAYVQKFVSSSDYSQSMQTTDWQGFGLIITQILLRYLGPFQRSDLSFQSDGFMKGTCVSFKLVNYFGERELQVEVIDEKIKSYKRFNSVPNIQPQQGFMITIKGQGKSKLVLADIDCEKLCYKEGVSTLLNDDVNLNQMMVQQVSNGVMSNFASIYDVNLKSKNNAQMKRLSTLKSLINVCNCNKILYADDEVFNQTSLTLLLKKMNLVVECAYHGQQALEMIKSKKLCGGQCKRYALIIMDCQMPIMDGWETTKKLTIMMQQKEINYIPIIGLTAFTSSKDVEQCLYVGMHSVLQKPLQLKKFKEVLESLDIPLEFD